jgi:hypothetical protein
VLLNLLGPTVDRLAVRPYLAGHFRLAQSFLQQAVRFKPTLL